MRQARLSKCRKSGSARAVWESLSLLQVGIRFFSDRIPLGKIGMPMQFAPFQITKQPTMDLHPREGKYVVVVRWPYPARQAGFPAGETAREIYGSLKACVNALETPEATRVFRFDYEKEPMIW